MGTYAIPSVVKGDTFEGVTFSITVNGTVLDLTNASIKMDLRLIPTGILAKRFILGSGLTIVTPPTNGTFTIDKQVIDLPANTYDYDIEITSADGSINTWITGTWQILQDVTHD